MTTIRRVKVTHTLSSQTRESLKQLVESGAVRDASSFIEEAVQRALSERKFRTLELELAAFDDPTHVAAVAAAGDDGLEDLAAGLRRD